MDNTTRLFRYLVIGITVLGWVHPAQAEGASAGSGGSASASLDFKIIIPPILRVERNSYPPQLTVQQNAADTSLTGEQQLVVLSTMRGGFCVLLRNSDSQIAAWSVTASGAEGVVVQAADTGYSVCTRRAGRYNMALKYDFKLKAQSQTPVDMALNWPISMELNAI